MPALTGTLKSEKRETKGFSVMLSPGRVAQAARDKGGRYGTLASPFYFTSYAVYDRQANPVLCQCLASKASKPVV